VHKKETVLQSISIQIKYIYGAVMLDIDPLASSSSSSSEVALAVDGNNHEMNRLNALPQDAASAIASSSTSRIETSNASLPSSSVALCHLSKSSSLYRHEVQQKDATIHANSSHNSYPTSRNTQRESNTPILGILDHQEKDHQQQLHQSYYAAKTLPLVHRAASRNSSSPSSNARATAASTPTSQLDNSGQDLDHDHTTTSQQLSSHPASTKHWANSSSCSISPLPTVAFTNHSTVIQNNASLISSYGPKHHYHHHHQQYQQHHKQKHFENPPVSTIADPIVLNNPIMNNFQSDFHFLNDGSGFTFPDYSMTMQQPSVNIMSSLEQGVVPTDMQKIISGTTPSSLLLGENDSIASQIPQHYPDLRLDAPSPSPFLDKIPMHDVHHTSRNTASKRDESCNIGVGGDFVGGGRKPKKDFQHRLEEIRKFQKKHGHSMVPHKYPMNPSLGTWVDTQRRRYRKLIQCKKNFYNENPHGTDCELEEYIQSSGPHISQEHIDQLLDVGFVFEPRLSRNDTWERRVEELKRFKELKGHCNVREDDVDFPGLGKWVSYVRRIYRLAKNNKISDGSRKGKRLSEDRIDELKQMGFIFELKEVMAIQRFKDGLQTLKEFKLREGHCRVPNFYVDNPTFGLCVEDMRTEYRMICNRIANGKDGFTDIMSHEIVQELAKMGFLSEEGITPYPSTECRFNSTCSTVSRSEE